jgi:hypothetical protein
VLGALCFTIADLPLLCRRGRTTRARPARARRDSCGDSIVAVPRQRFRHIRRASRRRGAPRGLADHDAHRTDDAVDGYAMASTYRLRDSVDVEPHVVDHHRLTQRGQHLVHEALAQVLGQLLHVRAEHDRCEELAWVLWLLGRRLQPALG